MRHMIGAEWQPFLGALSSKSGKVAQCATPQGPSLSDQNIISTRKLACVGVSLLRGARRMDGWGPEGPAEAFGFAIPHHTNAICVELAESAPSGGQRSDFVIQRFKPKAPLCGATLQL